MGKEVLHIYTRVTTDKQSEFGYSLEAQKKAGIEKANSLGMDWKLFCDAGISAEKVALPDRPQLWKLLELADEGEVKHIFATELDRLTRNPEHQFYIKKVMQSNNILLYTTSQVIDLKDEEMEFMSDLTALLSLRENKLRAKRIKRGLKESALKGKWGGVMLPYGYKRNGEGVLIADQEEKSAYLQMVEWSLSGLGTNAIALKLNKLGIPTRGKKVLKDGIRFKDRYTGEPKHNSQFFWKNSTVLGMLKNPLYKGKRNFKGDVIPFPALITSTKWQRIQDNLQQNKIVRTRPNNHFYLLKGIMYCGVCGLRTYGVAKKGENTYRCGSKRSSNGIENCGLRSINRFQCDDLVWNAVVNALSDSSITQLEFQRYFDNQPDEQTEEKRILKRIKIVNKQIDQVDQQRSNLVLKLIKDVINDEDFKLILVQIEQDKKELVLEIENLQYDLTVINTKDEMENWPTSLQQRIQKLKSIADKEVKKQIIQLFIQRIDINYNTKLKEHLVSITLKLPLFASDEYIGNYKLEGKKTWNVTAYASLVD